MAVREALALLAHLSSEVTSQLPNAKQADSEGEQVAGERFHGVLMMIVISCSSGSDRSKGRDAVNGATPKPRDDALGGVVAADPFDVIKLFFAHDRPADVAGSGKLQTFNSLG